MHKTGLPRKLAFARNDNTVLQSDKEKNKDHPALWAPLHRRGTY